MLSLRQIRRRLKSVDNTKKMTRAMEMVAASKLKKLQDLLRQSARYIGELKRILETLVREKPLAHPLLEQRVRGIDEKPAPTLGFLIASDTGLCGSYNANIMEQATRFIQSHLNSPLYFVSIGKQTAHFLKKNKLQVAQEFTIPRPSDIEPMVAQIAKIARDEFQSKKTDRVVFIYTKVFSLGSLRPVLEPLFPFASNGTGSATGQVFIQTEKAKPVPARTGTESIDYIIEPSLSEILDVILPEFIEAQISQWLKHALVAEQSSRMMAMRQATDNAEEMIESLTLARNKARQASITKELIEVVSGSRALK